MTEGSAVYVTALGTNEDLAKSWIAKMHGKYRIPVLLKMVDRLTKDT